MSNIILLRLVSVSPLRRCIQFRDVQKKALELFNTMSPEERGEQTFLASTGWVQRFLRRVRFSTRAPTSVGQPVPKAVGLLGKLFIQECTETITKNGGYSDRNITSM